MPHDAQRHPTKTNDAEQRPLVIERICIYNARIAAYVRVAPEFRITTPQLAAQVSEAFPNLKNHACIHSACDPAAHDQANRGTHGRTNSRFGDVMGNTSLPHLLEHLVIELQAVMSAPAVSAAAVRAAATSAAMRAASTGAAAVSAAATSVTSMGTATSTAPTSIDGLHGKRAQAPVGVTRWVDEVAGQARVEVSFTDDLVALRAFRDAAAFLNHAVLP